ncbi:MAG: Crp/Fnr family transcriptional regulator [Rhodobacterales bacterium]|nr:Crp/Fnr family transcriptional regulator [Rhodobacterales bacterium]
MNWVDQASDLSHLDAPTVARLNTLVPMDAPKGTVLFSPGQSVKGYVIVLKGRVNVSLTGASGREMLLYEVASGQSCIQSTLGLLGDEDYSAEAVVENDARLVLLPRAIFMELINQSTSFRALVFSAFAERMQTMMHILEKVAFQRVECRLAAYILEHADTDGTLITTQQELAAAVGSAREVVSRRLDAWSRKGFVKTARGTVQVLKSEPLKILAEICT